MQWAERNRRPHLLEKPACLGDRSTGVPLHGVRALAESDGLAGRPVGLGMQRAASLTLPLLLPAPPARGAALGGSYPSPGPWGPSC